MDSGIIYIVGRGHSGSTILGRLLHSKDIQDVGELVSGLGRFQNGECSCRKKIIQCPFWQKVVGIIEKDSPISLKRIIQVTVLSTHVRNFLKTLFASHESKQFLELAAATETIIKAISSTSGKRFVLDSSKEPTRALFLARFVDNSKFIHLVRHPEAVISAYVFRFNINKRINFLRKLRYPSRQFFFLWVAIIALSWLVGNFLVEIACSFAPGRFIRVRFEDLCCDPEKELKRLENFLGCDLQNTIDAVTAKEVIDRGHTIGGNAIRFQEKVAFNPSASKGRPLSWNYQMLVRVITWPGMLRYGYNIYDSDIR